MADLVRWTFATFHAAVLVLLAMWFVHLSGGLGDLLGGLNTAVGLGLYALLWAIVWWATGQAFDEAAPDSSSPRERAWAGFRYGAVTGMGFLLVILAGAFVVVAVTGGGLLPVVIIGVVGGLVALLVGGLIGAAFAMLDAPLVRAGEHLVLGTQ
jgi:hypothetical protein